MTGVRRLDMADAAALYLDLLKKALTGYLYRHENERELVALQVWESTPLLRAFPKRAILLALRLSPYKLYKEMTLDSRAQEEGRGFSKDAHTMIGLKRLENVQYCIERVLADNIPGDLIETGVWRGGSTIFMRGVLKAHGVSDRCVWVADSFEGLPPPQAGHGADAGARWHEREELKISLETVKRNFESYALLDDRVRFLKGFFKDTLPGAPIEALSVLRLDGDMYGSTMEALNALYDKLSPGGFCIIDDYAIDACKTAVDEFRATRGIKDEIQRVDWMGVFWRKTGSAVK